jgi:hypothetical protein
MTLVEQTWARFTGSPAGFRLKATALHLLVSLVIVLLAAAVVFLVWFPQGLADLLRGAGLFWLLITCDAILGPVLSFVICSPAKSRRMLVFDYAVIATIQLSALAYGLSVVAASRPVYAVFSVDRFDLVSAFEVETQDGRDLQALQTFPVSWFGPRLVALKLPEDTAGRNEALSLELSGGELQSHPRFLVSYSAEQVLANPAFPLRCSPRLLNLGLRCGCRHVAASGSTPRSCVVQTRASSLSFQATPTERPPAGARKLGAALRLLGRSSVAG